VAALLAASGAAYGQPQPTAGATAAKFTIFVRAQPVGSEEVAVQRTDAGWTISSTGRIGAPLDIQARRLEVRYSSDWKPLELTVEAFSRGELTTLHTTVSGPTATSAMSTNGTPGQKTDTIDPAALLLPNPFFGPYEALAARLRTAAADSTIPVYIAPNATLAIRVGASSPERIETPNRVIEARRTAITLMQPGLPLDAEIWADEAGRLLRLSVPANMIEVVRDDIAAVTARRVAEPRESDERVRIFANGFSMAATISKPAGPAASGGRLPAVVLVAGAGLTDRDETAFGIPIFAQLANALADAGYLVLRYDKRGVGQSGGRPESATLNDYAEDLRAAVRFLGERRDVDRRRMAVVGYREGGWIAMIAASKEDRIGAVVLAATPAVSGAELNIAQLTRNLERSNRPDDEKASTLALQKQIHEAATTGKGWESVPPAMRRQADTPWFQSFLTFNPSRVMNDVEQPLLILQGSLDTQVLPENADRLQAMAQAREDGTVDVAKVPGVNHLLANATTGEVDEYGTLPDKRVSADVASAITAWLNKTLPPERR
jgi:pimeloyl-ACP methyl ester carboxylesterase